MLGGPSEERKVSLRSGAAVKEALLAIGHRVTELDPVDDSWLLPSETEVVFLALHGTYGEDGTVQSRLEALDVPFTGCGSEVSFRAFDKVVTKQLCAEAGITVASGCVLTDDNAPMPEKLRLPVVLKPVRQGSSVGLVFVERPEDWAAALAWTMRTGDEIMVEEKVEGREVTVGLLGKKVFPVVEIRPKQGSYDYHNKYTPGATEYFCPAPFDLMVYRRIQEAGKLAFEAVGGGDYARMDFIVRLDGEPVLLEINTLPGLTETSLLPKAAQAAGMDFGELCLRMIDLAMRRVEVTTH